MKVLITDYDFPDVDLELALYKEAGVEVVTAQCRTEEEVIAASAGCQGLLVQYAPVNAKVFAARPEIRIASRYGAGFDTINTADAAAHGVWVANSPDYGVGEVATHALAMALDLIRNITVYDRAVKAGEWHYTTAGIIPRASDLTIGIIGLGRIGKAIAKRGEGFGMQIAYHGRNKQAGVSYDYYPTAVELAKNVKILVVVTPGGKETDKIVSSEVIDALGSKSYLINISRGSTVDEKALVKALVDGKLGGAGLDVFVEEPKVPEELFKLDNVVLQPHVGSGTHHTRNAMGQLVVDNLAAYFAGKPLLTEVPETL